MAQKSQTEQGKLKSQSANTSSQWNISESPLFRESLTRNTVIFADLPQKLEKFLEVKLQNPLSSRYGKHDSPCRPGSALEGFHHCHLRDDAILIYQLKERRVHLVYIAPHAEIEGKRLKQTAKRLKAVA